MDTKYEVSPYNFNNFKLGQIKIVDCTLRDGEQQTGVVFTKDDKVKIAKQLDKLGVYEIEAGMPVVSKEDYDAIYEIGQLGLKANISALARAKIEDIKMVKDLGVPIVRIGLPVGYLQLEYKLRKSENQVKEMFIAAAEKAKEEGLYVIISPYDTTRSKLPFLLGLLEELVNRKLMDRVRIVDTAASAIPSTLAFLTRAMKGVLKEIPIEIHCHNGLGLAVACTIEGILNGCEFVSVSMNGLGPRCGNTALEEVVMVLESLYKIPTGINLSHICETASLVEELSGIPINVNKPIIGSNAFSHEAGMSVAGVLRNPFTAEAYAPEVVGQKRYIALGKKSGLASIKAKLDSQNLNVSDNNARIILQKVKELSIREKRELTDNEFLKIVQDNLE